jgi:hypothetical protein
MVEYLLVSISSKEVNVEFANNPHTSSCIF